METKLKQEVNKNNIKKKDFWGKFKPTEMILWTKRK